ncbi:fibrinogen beta chain-like [Sinocyclocheilus grahami]|uniref:fibrinogen beta chain-like n=1 Tax=Sinocyclocheilus grahami TaxID=75366 RepID=UPI0007AC7893|nr:PREDICTED: fibrinogen beta chain-like [Sinocyclocheilus grahami]
MKLRFLLCQCVVGAFAQSDYDEDDGTGVLCPTGCELNKTLQKQERNVRSTVDQFKRSVDELTQSTNSIYGYVLDMTAEVAQRQRVSEVGWSVHRQPRDPACLY